jgi:adenosylmethionine-8-amino-7-oxononanoate aminotransferase
VLHDRCLEEGLIVRAIREGIALCPPLVITHEEIALVVERLGRALERTAEELLGG